MATQTKRTPELAILTPAELLAKYGPYLTREEVASVLGVSVPTVGRMTREGVIPSIQLWPRGTRYPLAQLLRG